MYTASMPPMLEGNSQPYRSFTQTAHRAMAQEAAQQPPQGIPAGGHDYERTCTPHNGCSLDATAETVPVPMKA